MEPHGKIQTKNVVVVIPARYASARLEGKLLLPINGKALILYTLDQARKARNISRVIVATDDPRIIKTVEAAGGEAILTSAGHQTGSDRVAEVAEKLPVNSIIVNVQGDEPLIAPELIDGTIEAILSDDRIDIVTSSEAITDAADVVNPNIVKVVCDAHGNALYFSRAPIPFPRDAVRQTGSIAAALEDQPALISTFRKHTGLYVYRRDFLLGYMARKQTALEISESLEQLRALEIGARIKIIESGMKSIGVDTAEDFAFVKSIIEKRQVEVKANKTVG